MSFRNKRDSCLDRPSSRAHSEAIHQFGSLESFLQLSSEEHYDVALDILIL